MAFQIISSAKNVPRFTFGLLVAPKLKKETVHNVSPEPGVDRINLSIHTNLLILLINI